MLEGATDNRLARAPDLASTLGQGFAVAPGAASAAAGGAGGLLGEVQRGTSVRHPGLQVSDTRQVGTGQVGPLTQRDEPVPDPWLLVSTAIFVMVMIVRRRFEAISH